jgi:hypothetical protein
VSFLVCFRPPRRAARSVTSAASLDGLDVLRCAVLTQLLSCLATSMDSSVEVTGGAAPLPPGVAETRGANSPADGSTGDLASTAAAKSVAVKLSGRYGQRGSSGGVAAAGASTGRARRSDSARRLAKHVHDGDLDDGAVLRHRQKSVAIGGAAPAPAVAAPVKLEVRFSWLNIHTVDTENQEFTAEFFVDARAKGRAELVPCADDTSEVAASRWTPELIVANMCDGELVRGEDSVHGADASYRRHWRGVFKQEFQLHEFPFDIQDFTLQLVEHTHDRVVSMVADDQLPSIFHVHSFALSNVWELLGIHEITLPTAFNSLDLSVRRLEVHIQPTHTDPSESARARAFPMLRAGVYMRRQCDAYCWNIIVPMFVMTSMSYVVSELPCDDLESRLSNDLALLLAAVAYKFVAAQGLPTLSYLTLLDKYVMLCFLWLALMVFINWLVVRIDRAHCAELDLIFLQCWLYSWLAVNVVMFVFMGCKVSKEHDGVKMLEQDRKPDSMHLQLHEGAKPAGHGHAADGSNGGGNGSAAAAAAAAVSSRKRAGLASRLHNAAALDEPLLLSEPHQDGGGGGSELPTIKSSGGSGGSE